MVLATDCGSTTTKAILIARTPNGYRLMARGEAPTTVEAPFDDVTVGVANAVRELEEVTGRRLLDEAGRLIRPARQGEGVDAYVSTSSAGGGLQMLVMGVVRSMTAESAQRAALGAGAIVMDTICSNDRRLLYQQIQRIRQLRPDMILLAGGIDGGTVTHVAKLAELVRAARPTARLGTGYRLPLVYAGNRQAREVVREILNGLVDIHEVENVRPVLEVENLGPARDAIHELFMEHVMAQAPGYDKLKTMTDAPIMPTPGAVGKLVEVVAREKGISVLGVDIGGATTDVFSVFQGKFNRTVSANLGMSYSVGNVLTSAGFDNVARWSWVDLPAVEVRNRVKNKIIRPTTIPHLLEDLVIEQALAREALRLSLEQHKEFATTLKGVQIRRTVADAFAQTSSGQTLVNMMELDLIIGSGGVLSHAPRREQAALMMIDAFEPLGVTQLAVDSIFMMPHLGVLGEIAPEAAMEVFWRDCLVPIGAVVAPAGRVKTGRLLLKARVERDDGSVEELDLVGGELVRVELREGMHARLTLQPARGLNVGEGRGRRCERRVWGGKVGIVFDGRGRPIQLPMDAAQRRQKLLQWAQAIGAFGQ
ncbi:MAG: glutamate mutase L [Candidatus Sumerlaeaceae bacterium]|nr:glutamate mutase L [Candidatus Sumerlaeaceae bacterium]